MLTRHIIIKFYSSEFCRMNVGVGSIHYFTSHFLSGLNAIYESIRFFHTEIYALVPANTQSVDCNGRIFYSIFGFLIQILHMQYGFPATVKTLPWIFVHFPPVIHNFFMK